MTETFADAVDRLRDVLAEQVEGWRRLLETTREAGRAVRDQDADSFERVLAEQVETLRELKEIEQRRARRIREVGSPEVDPGLAGLHDELRRLAAEVSRAARVGRFVIERNGALVEARLALHRRAGREPRSTAGVDRIA